MLGLDPSISCRMRLQLWQGWRLRSLSIQHCRRHCERSEAIQGDLAERSPAPLDCFVALLLAMTETGGGEGIGSNQLRLNPACS